MRHPWAVTVAATAISTYALDTVATAAGVLLVASHALDGLEQWHALVLLAVTYAAWGAGLSANVRANWMLLERTGTSTHDFAAPWTASLRARRVASAGGYVGTEVAKEAVYYVGAFGAVVFSESVSSAGAIVFLAGTNLGAAAYEYGLARLTRSVLPQQTNLLAGPGGLARDMHPARRKVAAP